MAGRDRREGASAWDSGAVSYDLICKGGSAIDAETWRRGMAELGVEVELHPELDMVTHTGLLPTRLAVVSATQVPALRHLVGEGPFEAAFDFQIATPAPDATATLAAVRAAGAARIAALQERDAPRILVEHIEDGLARVGVDPQRVLFSTSAGRTQADLVGQVIGCAAYAIASGGAFADPQSGEGPVSGAGIAPAASRLIARFLTADGGAMKLGAPFERWYLAADVEYATDEDERGDDDGRPG